LTEEQSAALAGDSTTASPLRRRTLNELLFPGPTRDFNEARATYGDLSVLPTMDYLYGLTPGSEHIVTLGKGKTVIVGLEAISAADERGYRTVMATLNGQLRPVSVRDKSVASAVAAAEKADTTKPGHIAAPFQGAVTVNVAVGDEIAAGDVVATIEAMKMEASITAPVAGTVERVALSGTQTVDGGDLVLVLS
ncbi:MAG: biotin/lipoyl-containing protein, partial [Nocardioides sp.]